MSSTYVLGYSHRELDRLDLQGLLYRDVTKRAFLDGGLEAGMRVLDVGCGSGDVARLAAGIVGPTGSVLAVDIDAGTIESARERTRAQGIENIRFVEGDASAFAHEGPFDALVGRFFLMHIDDPGAMLKKLLDGVKPGSPVIMVESNMDSLLDGVHSSPHSELFDRVVRWKSAVVKSVGADLGAGLRLGQIFKKAGLPEPAMRYEAHVESKPDSLTYRYVEESVLSMLPVAEQNGIEGFTEEEIRGLADELRSEVEGGKVLKCWPTVAAWSRRP